MHRRLQAARIFQQTYPHQYYRMCPICCSNKPMRGPLTLRMFEGWPCHEDCGRFVEIEAWWTEKWYRRWWRPLWDWYGRNA